jgi:SAM-dependent methyltransferase
MAVSEMNFSDGAAYERFMGRWSQIAGRQFLNWLNPSPKSSWLDVGCGNGAFTEEIITHCHPSSVDGIDPAQGQIAYAQKRTGTTMAVFQAGDAQSLPFADASFENVVMALVIAFVPDPAKAVAEMARVAKPGAIVATYMWDLPHNVPISPMHKALKEMGFETPVRPSPEAASLTAMHALWQDAGLQAIETTTIKIAVQFTSFDDFWQSCSLPVGPVAKVMLGLTENQRTELQKRLKANLPIAADGSISFPAMANAVKGRR